MADELLLGARPQTQGLLSRMVALQVAGEQSLQ